MKLFLRTVALTLDPLGWRRPAGGGRRLRRSLSLALFVPPFLLLQAVHWVGFLLDEIFFPAYRKVRVKDPLFVVGMPRSGTTFLHRTLAEDTDRFTTLRLWELVVAPSVVERKFWFAVGALDRSFGAPLRRLVGVLERMVLSFLDDVHPTRLGDPEEDYFFLLPAFACFLLVVPFPLHPAVWRLSRFDELPRARRIALIRFYRSCLQRHLYVVGTECQILSKNPSFTPMILSLREVFPDARMVCCVRDPAEAVASLLSSLEEGAEAFGWDVTAPTVRDRFVDMVVFYTEHALASLSAMPPDVRDFVTLPELHADAGGVVRRLYDRFSWTVEGAFDEALETATDRSRKYRSTHRYVVEEYGLDREQLDRRFAALNDRFTFDEGRYDDARDRGGSA